MGPFSAQNIISPSSRRVGVSGVGSGSQSDPLPWRVILLPELGGLWQTNSSQLGVGAERDGAPLGHGSIIGYSSYKK